MTSHADPRRKFPRMTEPMTVTFRGVRGSIACAGPRTVRYGGNTPCVEVRCGGRLLIFDAGSGLRALGDKLLAGGKPLDADIFLSHTHIDHIIGLPFFAPFYERGHSFRIWAGNLAPAFTTRGAIEKMMREPIFPITPDTFQADIAYRDFRAGETLTPAPGLTLRTGPLDHPGGATGYRLEFSGRVFAYLTDNEIRGSLDPGLIALARDADLAIYDCTYTDEEIVSKAGWGHSAWREGLRLADAADVKTFCLFHHAPEHDDDVMDRILAQARLVRPGTIAAIEGRTIEL
jgi:phosphoribosyl 1,2-cyclic phosphodiesterase